MAVSMFFGIIMSVQVQAKLLCLSYLVIFVTCTGTFMS